MSPLHQKIHDRCIRLCRELIQTETAIVAQLQLVQKFKIHHRFEKKNLFLYAKDICGLSENQAYAFSALAKCSLLHPQLDDAIQNRKLSISKAGRLVSTLTKQNASDLIDYACRHSKREIEREVRRLNPKASVPATIKPISENLDVLNTAITCDATDNIRKATDLLSQKHGRNIDLGETLALVFEEFVERHDPLRRAARFEKRKEKRFSEKMNSPASARETVSPIETMPAAVGYPHFSARAKKSIHSSINKIIERNDEALTAAQIHKVDLRDGRRCTFTERNGHRCSETRWLHYHHIVSRASGGSNEPDNLTTLCSFHHDLVHQLSFPMEGAMNLVRDRWVNYG